MEKKKNNITTPDATKNESGLTQMIMMGKFFCPEWVNCHRLSSDTPFIWSSAFRC